MNRIRMRGIDRDEKGSIRQVIEQEIPMSIHEIELLLRRQPFRLLIAHSLLEHGSVTLELPKP